MPSPVPNFGKGRPKGSLNQRTRLKIELFGNPKDVQLPLTPTQVLAHNMDFFQTKSEQFVGLIQDHLNAGGTIEGVQDQLDQACKLKILANTAATMLAPYVHPKVTAVPQQSEDVKPFVIRVPDMLPSPEAWAHAVSRPKDITIGRDDGIST